VELRRIQSARRRIVPNFSGVMSSISTENPNVLSIQTVSSITPVESTRPIRSVSRSRSVFSPEMSSLPM